MHVSAWYRIMLIMVPVSAVEQMSLELWLERFQWLIVPDLWWQPVPCQWCRHGMVVYACTIVQAIDSSTGKSGFNPAILSVPPPADRTNPIRPIGIYGINDFLNTGRLRFISYLLTPPPSCGWSMLWCFHYVPSRCPDVRPVWTCTGRGIIWPRAVFSCLVDWL